MSKVNGLLNFVRKVFNDEYQAKIAAPYDLDSNERHVIMPGVSSTSVFGGMEAVYGAAAKGLKDYLAVDTDLVTRYIDYEDADDLPEIATALDIFADDATQPDGITGKAVNVNCKDQTIKEILSDMYHENLRIDEDIWEMARTLCKYGNDFEEVCLQEGQGVVGLNFLPPATTRRVEDTQGSLLGFIQDYTGSFAVNTDEFQERLKDREVEHKQIKDVVSRGGVPLRTFENWEVIHMRLRSKHRRAMYGFSVVDSARWVIKRLTLLEDSMLVYRLSRAPERFAFYVDVGDIPPNEALKYVRQIKNDYKKKKWIDPSTGKIDFKYNPLSSDEDFFVPTRGDKRSTQIETIGGFQYQGIDDVNYFKDKLFTGIKVPKDYLNYSDGGGATKSNLSQEDMRFARTILRVQNELRTGLKKIGMIHLSALGIDPNIVEWNATLNPPSSIFELAQMEVRNAQLDLADKYKAFASQYWIMTNILHLTDDEILKINKERTDEAAMQTKYPGMESREYPSGFFQGNKESEKILSENWETVMKKSPSLKRRFDELKGLINDMRPLLMKR